MCKAWQDYAKSSDYTCSNSIRVRSRPPYTMAEATFNNSIHMGATDHTLGAAFIVTALLKDVSKLIPIASPLASVLGITKELLNIINQMRVNHDECLFLVERILRFLKHLYEESVLISVPIQDDSHTVSRLKKLVS